MRNTPATTALRCPSRGVFAAATCLLAVASSSAHTSSAARTSFAVASPAARSAFLAVASSSAHTYSAARTSFAVASPAARSAFQQRPVPSRPNVRSMTASSRLESSEAAGPSSAVGTQQQSTNDPLVELGLPSPLILGSGSFTRKLILKEMGIKYEILVRPIDEKGIGDRDGDPAALVETIAKAKGDHLVRSLAGNDGGDPNDDCDTSALPDKVSEGDFGGYVVLTADQVVTHEGSILEKPDSAEEARDFVARYADSPPKTVGACVLTHIPSGVQVSGVDSAQINFAQSVADGDLVGRLLDDGAPVLSCAGGLMVEHPLVRKHVESIDGTEDSVMGLSKDLVLQLLSEMKEKLK